MAKYIIELPDKNKHIYINENNVLFLRGTIFKEKLFGKVETHDVHVCTGINAFPYYDPDRKAIEDEVWEFAHEISCMKYEEIRDCFGIGYHSEIDVVSFLTHSKAKAKYEEWKKQKEDEATMKEVTALAEKIGIHKLYSMVKEIRGEQE